jgi:hypothetical protein
MSAGAALRSAAVTMAAVIVTLGVAIAIDPEPGLAVFGMLLAITLSGSELERDLRGRLEAGLALPVVSLAGAGVGVLLATAPWIGASLFTVAVAGSVLLRRFGALGRRLGGLVALPFTALLVAPVHSERLGPLAGALAAVVVGLVAWAAVTALQLAAVRLGILPRPMSGAPEPAAGAGALRPDATTRLSLQMLAAVGGAFAIGFLAFPDRWSWVVISALTVTLGNTGRADVADKAVQRVVGAGLGSVLALGVLLLPHPDTWVGIAVVLAALFAGLVLRPFGYVWWSLALTVALAVAQSFSTGPFSLPERWAEIVVGGVLAVVVAFVLLPVPSEAVVRRRIGDVLEAASAWLALVAPGGGAPDRDAEGARVAERALRSALARLDRAARPFDDARRWLPARWRPRAVGWVATTRAIAGALLETPRAAARRPLGEARRSLRTPVELQGALEGVLAAARP